MAANLFAKEVKQERSPQTLHELSNKIAKKGGEL
jgi:hypothetical protein